MATTVEEQEYRSQSRIYLSQALRELENNDRRQASEKGWGAATQIVKAAAHNRGWRHGSHRLLNEAASSLREETGNSRIGELFRGITALHVNFYEGGLGYDDVKDALDQVQDFVETIEAVLDDEGPSLSS